VAGCLLGSERDCRVADDVEEGRITARRPRRSVLEQPFSPVRSTRRTVSSVALLIFLNGARISTAARETGYWNRGIGRLRRQNGPIWPRSPAVCSKRAAREIGHRLQEGVNPRRLPARSWLSLTDTERAVAHLAAQGLSSRVVADRMPLPQPTVRSHLRRV
jgi:DNA-binding CsgD family transcriptional regulator